MREKTLEERYPKTFLLQSRIVELLSDNIPRTRREIAKELKFSVTYIRENLWCLLGKKVHKNKDGTFTMLKGEV